MAIVCKEKPELLVGKPIGQYHCPECGMLVMAGLTHPDFIKFREADSITKSDMEFLGIPKQTGFYATDILYNVYGPFETEDEAEREWLARFEQITGKEWDQSCQEN